MRFSPSSAARKRATRISPFRTRLRRGWLEALEPRLCMASNVNNNDWLGANDAKTFLPNVIPAAGQPSMTPDAVLVYDTQANGLPILNTIANAPAGTPTIWLDLEGGQSNTGSSNSPFDFDNNTANYNAEEQNFIAQLWREVASIYSEFNFNVTTVHPNLSTYPTAAIMVTPSYSGGGVSNLNAFPNRDYPRATASQWAGAETIAHELGHNLGLNHTSAYDVAGNNVFEYSSLDKLHGAIMGDRDGVVSKWVSWHDKAGITSYQDEVQIIANDSASQVGGDGFKTDDFGPTTFDAGNVTSGATALTALSGGTQTFYKKGTLERLTDADTFSFTAAFNTTYNITVGRYSHSGVDTKVSVYNSSGTLLASTDGDPRNAKSLVNNSHLTVVGNNSTYYVVVESHGNYADLGSYAVRVDRQAPNWKFDDVGYTGVAGFASYNSGTGTFTVGGGGSDIWDATDAFGFNYRTLVGDGTIVAKVGTRGAADSAKAGIMIRQAAPDGSPYLSRENAPYVFLGTYPDGGRYQFWRDQNGNFNAVDGINDNAYSWLKLVRQGNTFTSYISTDGVNWGNGFSVGQPFWQTTVNMTGKVLIGMAVNDRDNNQLNLATFSNVTVTPQNGGTLDPALVHNNLAVATSGAAAPTGLAVAAVQSNSIALSWPNQPGNNGYFLERSTNNIKWDSLASLPASATSYTNTGLADFQTYFYRLRTRNSSGQASNASAVVSARTWGGSVSNAKVTIVNSTTASIDWTAASGVSTYTVYRSTSPTGPWSLVTNSGNNLTNNPNPMPGTRQVFNDFTRTTGTKYYYLIESSNGNATVPSTTVTDMDNVSFPIRSGNQIQVSWDAPGTGNFKVERSTDAYHYSVVSTIQSGTTYTDNNVQPGFTYYYKITTLAGSTVYAVGMNKTTTPGTVDAAWTQTDIGSPTIPGASNQSGSTFTVSGGDVDYAKTKPGIGQNFTGVTNDQLHFVYLSVPDNQNVAIQGRMTFFDDGAAEGSNAGLMFRQSTATNSRYFALEFGAWYERVSSRTSTGGTSGNPWFGSWDSWMKITRTSSTTFKAYTAPDNNGAPGTWTLRATQTINMGTGGILMGIFGAGFNPGGLAQITLDNVDNSYNGSIGQPTATSTLIPLTSLTPILPTAQFVSSSPVSSAMVGPMLLRDTTPLQAQAVAKVSQEDFHALTEESNLILIAQQLIKNSSQSGKISLPLKPLQSELNLS